jgi:threonine synthase
MKNYVTHLECANCGQHYDPEQIQGLCTKCQRPLWVKYDLAAVAKNFSKQKLAGRPFTMWRYLEMLPIQDPGKIVSLAETVTPILETKRIGAALGLTNLFVKDESRLPTGSFKARGMAMAISKANEFGIRRLAAPTAGNAGGPGRPGSLCLHAAGHPGDQCQRMLAGRRQNFPRQWPHQRLRPDCG